jgi:hypothetical protein
MFWPISIALSTSSNLKPCLLKTCSISLCLIIAINLQPKTSGSYLNGSIILAGNKKRKLRIVVVGLRIINGGQDTFAVE